MMEGKEGNACLGSVAAAARCDHMLLQVDSVSRQLYQSGGGIDDRIQRASQTEESGRTMRPSSARR